jgi:RimJ/RimL family protein N-acetyltransferase
VTGFAELDPTRYPSVEPLLATLSSLHGSIPAVLCGTATGRIRVDDSASPRVVLLDGPEGLYLGGEPHAGLDWEALRASIHPFAYLYPAEAWLPVIDAVLPHPFMLRHERVTLALDPTNAGPDPAPRSEGFATRPMAEGIGAEIVEDSGLVVAHCHEDMRVGDRVEVGIWTHPRFRRQGLARLAVASAVDVARTAGLRRMGWHCLASNAGSLNTALRSGFAIVAEYVAYGACLPAENRDDLDTAQWLDLAAHFERGAARHPLLRVYAAEALAAAGQPHDALAALERLVETNWNGEADWLLQSWAFEPIRDDPRFLRVIARQRQTESAGETRGRAG